MKSTWIITLGLIVALCGCAILNDPDVQKLIEQEIAKVLAEPELVVPSNAVPVEVVTTNPAPEASNDLYVSSKFHTTSQEAGTFPIISTLTVTKMGSKFRMDVDAATRAKWPRDVTINLMCTLQDDKGQWHTAPCDWVKPLPNVKELKSLVVCDGDKQVMWPVKGKLVGITLSSKCRHGVMSKEHFRSTTVWLTCDWVAEKQVEK